MVTIYKATRWLMLLLVTITSAELSAQTVAADLQEYFYPFAKFTYILSPDSDNPNTTATYSLSSGNILTKTTEICYGYSTQTIAVESYKLILDEEYHAVVSTQQIIQNSTGTRRSSDDIIMFLLPEDDNTISWTETVNGEITTCSAKFVYITFTFDGRKLYRKAVKIEKTTPLDNSSSVKEWSYWVRGLSRLASYGYWGDSTKVNCLDRSVNISRYNPIIEISKAEYDSKQ